MGTPIIEIKGTRGGWDRVERGHGGIVFTVEFMMSMAGGPYSWCWYHRLKRSYFTRSFGHRFSFFFTLYSTQGAPLWRWRSLTLVMSQRCHLLKCGLTDVGVYDGDSHNDLQFERVLSDTFMFEDRKVFIISL